MNVPIFVLYKDVYMHNKCTILIFGGDFKFLQKKY